MKLPSILLIISVFLLIISLITQNYTLYGLTFIAFVIWLFVASASQPLVRTEEEDKKRNPKDYKTCPQCAELVKKDALVCRYCGNKF